MCALANPSGVTRGGCSVTVKVQSKISPAVLENSQNKLTEKIILKISLM